MQAGNGPDVMALTAGSGQAATVGQFSKAGLLLRADGPRLRVGHPRGGEGGLRVQRQALRRPELDRGRRHRLQRRAGQADRGHDRRLVHPRGRPGRVQDGAGSRSDGLRPGRLDPGQHRHHVGRDRHVHGLRPDPDWNQKRADGKTTFAKTQGWHDALQTVVDLNKNGCFQDGAAGAGFDALTNGATSGKLYGFFAPSGAVKSIQDASGGHVKLIALPIPAARAPTPTWPSPPTSGWPATPRPRARSWSRTS